MHGYTPSPSIFWNHGVTAGLPPKSLRNKDLYVKYSGIRSYGFQIAFGAPALGIERFHPTGGLRLSKSEGLGSYFQIANCTFHIISALTSGIKGKGCGATTGALYIDKPLCHSERSRGTWCLADASGKAGFSTTQNHPHSRMIRLRSK